MDGRGSGRDEGEGGFDRDEGVMVTGRQYWVWFDWECRGGWLGAA